MYQNRKNLEFSTVVNVFKNKNEALLKQIFNKKLAEIINSVENNASEYVDEYPLI